MSYNPNNQYAPEGYPIDEDFSSYLLRVIPKWTAQTIVFVLSMFLGYKSGYKKREKDRKDMMSEH